MGNSKTYGEFKYELDNAVKSHYGDAGILSIYKCYKDSGDLERFEAALGRWAVFADVIDSLNHGASRYQIAKEYIDLVNTGDDRDYVVKKIKYGPYEPSKESDIENTQYAERFIADVNQRWQKIKDEWDAACTEAADRIKRPKHMVQSDTTSSNYSPNLFERKQKQLLEKYRSHHHHEHHCHSKRPRS